MLKHRGWDKILHLLHIEYSNKQYPKIPYYYYNNRRVVMKNEIDKNIPCNNRSVYRYIEECEAKPIEPLSSHKFEVYYLDVIVKHIVNKLQFAVRSKQADKIYTVAKNIYSFIDTYAWQYKYQDKIPQDANNNIENINLEQEHSPQANKLKTLVEFDNEMDKLKLKKFKIDLVRAEQEAEIATLKRKQLQGSLISTEDVKKSQCEQAVIHITQYQNDKKLLPTKLEGLSKAEMRIALDEHYKKRITDLHQLFDRRHIKTTDQFYDVLEVILEKLKTQTPDEVIERLS